MLSSVVALVTLVSPPPSLSQRDALCSAVVRAYGGPEALARSLRSRAEGEVQARMNGGAGTLRRDFEAPGRLRVTIEYPNRTELRLLDGAEGWRGGSAGVLAVEGLPHLAMVYQLLRTNPAWALDTHRERVELAGSHEVAGRPHWLLRLAWSPGLTVLFSVDARTYHVGRVEGVLSAGGLTTAFATEYDGFEVVDGVLVPRIEETWAGGRHTGTTRLTSVSFGAPDLGPFRP